MRALEDQHSREAKLLSLLIYGLACVRTRELYDEYDELHRSLGDFISEQRLMELRARIERQCVFARSYKRQIERALEQYVSTELLLVTSPPLRQELRDIAQAVQAKGHPHICPQRVNREIARCTWRGLTELGTPPPYLGGGPREYLIHTAVAAQAEILITEDKELALPGNASFCDPKTRRSVRPYTVDDFCEEHLPSQLDIDAIDAAAVFRAQDPAAKPLPRDRRLREPLCGAVTAKAGARRPTGPQLREGVLPKLRGSGCSHSP